MSATTAELTQTLPIFLKELRRYSVPMAWIFAIIALVSLLAGVFWPRTYVASTSILAQGSDIIQPLLEGRAVATGVTDRAGMARQVIYSRGVLADVSAKLLDQFVQSLERDVLSSPAAEPAAAAAPAAPAAAAAEAPPAPTDVAAEPAAAAKPAGVRKIDSPEAKPVDLLDSAGLAVGKRVGPIVGVLVVVLWLLRRRRRKSKQ